MEKGSEILTAHDVVQSGCESASDILDALAPPSTPQSPVGPADKALGADLLFNHCIAIGHTLDECFDILEKAQSGHLVNGDPNSFTGPDGFGPSGYITPAQTLPYTIAFQNEPTADIPVQQVVVTDQLDPNLDWTTFQVGDFSIAGTTYRVPANTGSYSTRIDLTSTLGIYLDVTAAVNLTTGIATWTFTSIDPKTGDLPADIFTGFLPADKTAPQGEAFVTYTVRA